MSSLDHDRLLHEGPEPRTRTGSTLAPAGGPRSRRRAAAPAGKKAPTSAPAQRQGETHKSGAATTAKRTATRTAPARTGTGRPRTRAAAEEAVAQEVIAAQALIDAGTVADVEDAASLVAAEEARSRAVVGELAAAEPDLVVVKELPAGTVRAWSPRHLVARSRQLVPPSRRLASALRRRPAVYLAAAVVGAVGIGAISVGTAAQAEPADRTSHSMSVAAELGITSEQVVAAPDAAATDRLAEQAASRVTREAEQTAAVEAQHEADRIAAEAAAAAAAEAARPKAVLPVDGARLSSTFGSRWGTLHAGIDLAAPIGTPEYAAADGVVLEAGPASGFGLAVYIQHDNGDVTVYGHMQQILVQAGQVVKAGDTIALLGNRGQSTGPHLHFEVHVGGIDGAKIDPLPWLRERGVQI